MLLQCWLATHRPCAVLQRLIEMRSDEAERTRGVRDKKEKKRADKEMARLQAQYVSASIAHTCGLWTQFTPQCVALSECMYILWSVACQR